MMNKVFLKFALSHWLSITQNGSQNFALRGGGFFSVFCLFVHLHEIPTKLVEYEILGRSWVVPHCAQFPVNYLVLLNINLQSVVSLNITLICSMTPAVVEVGWTSTRPRTLVGWAIPNLIGYFIFAT